MSGRRQMPGRGLGPDARHASGAAQRPSVLRIEKPIYGGAGLARDDGKAVFIPYTLPGELVAAVVTHSKASFAEAALAKLYEPSPDRVEPPCPYFGSCGGCHYQHANYPAQLAIKVAILEETLARAHLSALPQIVTHAGEPFGYRNRVRLHLAPFAPTAREAVGYRARASHHLIAVEQCPIAAPALEQALGHLARAAVEQQCGSYFSQAEVSINQDGTALLLALWPRPAANLQQAGARLTSLCEALQARLPGLQGAAVHAPVPGDRSAARRGGAQGPQGRTGKGPGRFVEDEAIPDSPPGVPIATWGASHMTYKVGSFEYRVSLGSFFQINRTLLERLVELATGGRQGGLAWDLYAGVGLFSRVLTEGFAQVVAVEAAPTSFDDLRLHLAAPHQAVQGSTAEFLRRAAAGQTMRMQGGTQKQAASGVSRPDFVLVDPPRAGLGEEVTSLLARIGPPEITYVSCDPATLSRDLRALVDSGYALRQMHLIDLFPQTFHLETVAMLSRG